MGTTSVADLIEHCRGLDIRLWADEGRLRFDAPAGALDPALRAELVARKADLLAILSPPAPQPPPRFTGEEHTAGRWGPAQDDPTPGIDSKARSRTGPPRASDPEALAERATIQAEATQGPMAPPGAAPSPTPRPPSPPGGAPRPAGTPAPPALAPSPVARRWCCSSVGCSAGWWEAPGYVIRCRSCEPPPHVWWIVAQGEIADAPWVAPFQNRKSDKPRWRREPRPEIPIRFGPEPQRTELPDPGWIQDPEEETFEG
jgi:hypothetical protein